MTELVSISSNASAKETTANENFEAASPAGAFGNKHTTTTGVTYGYYGGVLNVDGTLTVVADGTVGLQANNTNYVQMTRSGTVVSSTGGFQAGTIPLAVVVTNTSSAIATISDRRLWCQPPPALYTSVRTVTMTSSSYTMTENDWRGELLWVVGSAGALIVPTVPRRYGVINNCALQTLVKTSAGSGITIAASRAADVTCTGSHVFRMTADATYAT